jgi:hypothetical protein
LFDPRLDLPIDSKMVLPGPCGTDPETGRRYVGRVLQTSFDHLNQVRHDLWLYTEIGINGERDPRAPRSTIFLRVCTDTSGVHTDPCACTGIYVVPTMRLGSSTVRWGIDACSLRFRSRSTHDRTVFVEGHAAD